MDSSIDSKAGPALTVKTRRVPAEEGLWVFIIGDMMIFALFFGVYTYYRGQEIDVFSDSQKDLNKLYGLVNMILLLTSSWFIALALKAVRSERGSLARGLIALGMGCGIGFAVLKVVEYSEKADQGISLITDTFFTFYFMLTGIHFFHVFIGLGVLTFLFLKARNTSFSESDIRTFEGGAVYWHMVDLLWVILFPLLYLLG